VEEFRVGYRVLVSVAVEADSVDGARGDALRELRAALEGTRHRRIQWVKTDVT
jgi:hypothetical protein